MDEGGGGTGGSKRTGRWGSTSNHTARWDHWRRERHVTAYFEASSTMTFREHLPE